MATSINFSTYGFINDILALNEENWRKFFKPFVYDSVQSGLEVTSGTGMTVDISAGECRCGAVMGVLNNNATLNISNADTSNNRIDSVVVQYSYGDPSTLSVKILTGTPASIPNAPTLSKNFDTLWQMEIAQILVPANATSSSSFRIVDKRIIKSTEESLEEIHKMLNFHLMVEQGSLNNNGVEIESTTSLRTGFLKFASFPTIIVPQIGYKIGYRGYSDNFEYNARSQLTTNPIPFSELHYKNRYVRFIVAREDNGAITVDEFKNAVTLTNMYTTVEAEQYKIKNEINDLNNNWLVFNTGNGYTKIYVEQGSIRRNAEGDFPAGTDKDSTVNLRTGYLKFENFPVNIYAAPGYKIASRTYLSDLTYESGVILGSSVIIDSSSKDKFTRLLLSKEDQVTTISVDEFYDAINSQQTNLSTSGVTCFLPSETTFDKITKLEENVGEINNDISLANLNLNFNQCDNSDMAFEYDNWYYPEVVSYQNIRDRLYFTFTGDSGYSGVAQYDFDTKELTKTILKKGVPAGVKDDHNCAAVIMPHTERLLCAYAGGHGGDNNIYIRYAEAKEDIGIFGDVIVLPSSGSTTYSQLFEYYDTSNPNDKKYKVYLFYRTYSSRWAYRVMTWKKPDGGLFDGSDDIPGEWSDEIILIKSTEQMYCQFSETTQPGVLRVLAYTNPSGQDSSIRMCFFNLNDNTLYDTDNITSLGTNNVMLSDITQLVPIPTGKTNRIFHAAKTPINKTLFLFCEFTDDSTIADGQYKIYDDGNIVFVANAGEPLLKSKYQLGVHWIGTDKVVVARGAETDDVLEIYNYVNGTISFDKLVTSHTRYFGKKQNYRTARPMVDENKRAIIYMQGYYRSLDYKHFIMNACIYNLNTDQIFPNNFLIDDKANAILNNCSGKVSSFTDGAKTSVSKLNIAIEPVQSGSGDPSPENIRPISGWTGMSIMHTGKNLFDVNSYPFTDGYYIKGSDGAVGGNGTAQFSCTQSFIPFSGLDGKSITLNKRPGGATPGLAFYSTDNVSGLISAMGNGNSNPANTPWTVTVPVGTKYMRFTIQTGATDIQIEIGETATAYEPYQGTTYPISWQSIAGTVYGGKLDVLSGVLTVTHGFFTVTGDADEMWTVQQSGTDKWYYRNEDAKSNVPSSSVGKFANWIMKNGMSSNNSNQGFILPNTGQLGVRFGTEDTVANWKTYLANHNLQICYPLRSPVTYQLTPIEFATMLGVNNIWADTGDNTVEYKAETSIYIENTKKEVENNVYTMITNSIENAMIATKAYEAGDLMIINNQLLRATSNIANGTAITIGTSGNTEIIDLATILKSFNQRITALE